MGTPIELGGNGSDGAKVPGLQIEVASITSGASRTLVQKESDTLFLLDAATALTYVLPAWSEGLRFSFLTTVAVSGALHTIKTADGAKVIGAVMGGSLTVADSGDVFQGNGSTHIGVAFGGTTTGGLVGTYVTFTAITTGIWGITGGFVGSGTLADPFITT